MEIIGFQRMEMRSSVGGEDFHDRSDFFYLLFAAKLPDV